jgi:iron complex transport system substrate-binding protein
VDSTRPRPGRHRPVALLAVIAAVAAAACGSSGQVAPGTPRSSGPSFPVTVKDDDGATVIIRSAPQRIITFAPSDTEIVYALGLGGRLVGVSGSFDNYPPQAAGLPHVSDASFQPNTEKVVSLKPDLFLMGFAGYQRADQRLRALGIPVIATVANDFDDLLRDIATIGRATGATGEAAGLVSTMRARAAAFQAKVTAEPRVSCFFDDGLYSGAVSTVGPGSFIYDLLQRAGCDPVTSGAKSAYPQWSMEQLVKDDPHVYLIASEAGVSLKDIEKRPGFSELTAAKEGRVYVIDSDILSRPGPRVVQGLEALVRALHPAVA